MKIVIIGSGNVATILGKMIQTAGHEIAVVVARSEENAQELASDLKTKFHLLNNEISLQADVVLVAVSDTAIVKGINYFDAGNAVWAHTAGSVPMSAINGAGENYGVFYPLQSLNKNNEQLPTVPLLITASNDFSYSVLQTLAHSISGNVNFVTDEQRLQYHVNAVFVSNFTNHLYRLVQDYCEKQHLDFKLLMPLINETTNRLTSNKAADVQTGPAVRNDEVTLQKHLEILNNEENLHDVYKFLSENILKVNAT